jgi:hypothetical protein
MVNTEQALAELAARGHETVLERATGTVRIDLRDGRRTRHWYLDIHRGDVSVSRDDQPADCVVRSTTELFDEIVSGRRNAMVATLRNELTYEGEPKLLVLVRRLFPWPPREATR